MKHKVWLGLVCIRGTKPNAFLGASLGAYTTIFAWAVDEEDFCKQASIALREQIGLYMESAEDIEPFEARLLKHEPTEDFKQLANEVATTHEVEFDGFFFWDEPEELSDD